MANALPLAVAFALAVALGLSGCSATGKTAGLSQRVDLHWDASEAEAALDLMSRAARSESISSEQWAAFRATSGYQRLSQREAKIGRAIDDGVFQAFLISPDTRKREPELRATLERWHEADLEAAAARVLAYLPEEARIRATVFPMIKPQANSFVFEPSTNPAIFLYLDPALSREQFENTVAHELHHIGFASLPSDETPRDPRVQTVVMWMGAFGEGFAMLAAAGGPDVHPHEHSPAADRERWDHDVAAFDADLARVQTFFTEVLDGKLASEAEIQKVAFSFFGVQGPWYTVGWKMAVVVEKRYGRAVLIEGMRHPERLLATYDRAAKESNARGGPELALWSDELLARVGATPIVP